jgi:hypothetical protein
VLPVEIEELGAVEAVDGEYRQDSHVESDDDDLQDLGGGHRFLLAALAEASGRSTPAKCSWRGDFGVFA